jgi:hypothetical protein
MPERNPVLVGGGQIVDQPEDPTAGLEPLRLMEEATRRALADAHGTESVLAAVDTLAVVNVICHDYTLPRCSPSASAARRAAPSTRPSAATPRSRS